MIEAATTGLTTAVGWVGTVVDALTKTDGGLSALLPLLGIGVGVSALFMGVKAIRSFIWGA